MLGQREAQPLDSFLAAPIGKYIVGERWLFCYATPSFSSLTLWGRAPRLTGDSSRGRAR